MLELGADPLMIAEVDALLVADAETSAWVDGQEVRSGSAPEGDAELGEGDMLGSWKLLQAIGTAARKPKRQAPPLRAARPLDPLPPPRAACN